MQLKNNIFTEDQIDGVAKQLSDCCCAFSRRLDSIECISPGKTAYTLGWRISATA